MEYIVHDTKQGTTIYTDQEIKGLDELCKKTMDCMAFEKTDGTFIAKIYSSK